MIKNEAGQLIFPLVEVKISQKLSVIQIASLVPQALTLDNPGE